MLFYVRLNFILWSLLSSELVFAKKYEDVACVGMNPAGHLMVPKKPNLKYTLISTEEASLDDRKVVSVTTLQNSISEVLKTFQNKKNVVHIKSIASSRINGKSSPDHPNDEYQYEDETGLYRWDPLPKAWINIVSFEQPMNGKTWTDKDKTTYLWEYVGDFTAVSGDEFTHTYRLTKKNSGKKNKGAWKSAAIYAPFFGLIQSAYESDDRTSKIVLGAIAE